MFILFRVSERLKKAVCCAAYFFNMKVNYQRLGCFTIIIGSIMFWYGIFFFMEFIRKIILMYQLDENFRSDVNWIIVLICCLIALKV